MRRFRIGDVAGNWHSGDWFKDSEIQEHLDEHNGYIGQTTDGKDVYVETVDEAMDFMSSFLKIDDNLNSQVFHMEINGVMRAFNVRHIVFWEIEKRDENTPNF